MLLSGGRRRTLEQEGRSMSQLPINRNNNRRDLSAVVALLAAVAAAYLVLDIAFTDQPMPTGRSQPCQVSGPVYCASRDQASAP